ncbi:5'/3'-nucleotidase SurE [Salinisphaera sp. Q1T1-3]|uniref:5'/3'-nucleotidase SurE n=1 Tax=Salinisphaera sp. Q1T1-3 TaxID=2321229 RepID=UPI000E73F24B|nr:5'/3'-nucleotidase SurE [Salinisphaera sp. Q1T1-3]RJS91420.1 5'/3'-nucleotidase SurE [Salinisphaera sp. Q1T1-3]
MKELNRVLVTNDDGIDAPGLAVAETLAARLAAEVWVFAPSGNRSGTAQALTLHDELSVSQRGPRRYAVTGTPADCVMAALGGPWLDGATFDLVLSGVNWGGNLSDSVMYSGTVGAALAGAHFDIPAMALSQAFDGPTTPDFSVARAWGEAVFERLWPLRDRHGCCWNVNFPSGDPETIGGLRFTRQTGGAIRATRMSRAEAGADYRLSFTRDIEAVTDPHADVVAIRERAISVTPLTCTRHDNERLSHLGAGAEIDLRAPIASSG